MQRHIAPFQTAHFREHFILMKLMLVKSVFGSLPLRLSPEPTACYLYFAMTGLYPLRVEHLYHL